MSGIFMSDTLPLTIKQTSRRGFFEHTGVLLASVLYGGSPVLLAQSELSNAELDARLFPGFMTRSVDANSVTIHTLIGGSGPPVLLLHGAPQSHLAWGDVAVQLSRDFTVVVTDLRGYGWSSKPDGGENHINYSKRTMAQDQLAVMNTLGFSRFHLVGHDRGGRVARRLAIDHPDAVTTLTVLDIVPAHYLYAHVTREFVDAYIHWFMFIQPAPFPENIIAKTGLFSGGGPGDVGAAYRKIYEDPAAIHAMCEDYRASAGMDITIDEADLAAGKKIECPLNVLWGDNAAMGRMYEVLAIWQMEATNAEGKAMRGGHSFQTEYPDPTYAELKRFLQTMG